MRKTQSLQEVLKVWMKNSGKENLFNELQIKEKWSELLGENIQEKTKAINWVAEDQLLLIKVTDALLRNELSYAKESIKEKLNNQLRGIQIEKIVIV